MRIGVVGSMNFADEMTGIVDQLNDLGHDAFCSKLIDNIVGKNEQEKEDIKLYQKFNNDAIRSFWKEMQNADAILVCNWTKNGIENYIGGNTLMEIGFAHVLEQKIFLLNPIPNIDFYKTEIEAVKPTIVNEDLFKII